MFRKYTPLARLFQSTIGNRTSQDSNSLPHNSIPPSMQSQSGSSSTEETRKVVQEWIDLVKAQHYDQLHTLATPDANWWVSGPKDKISIAGDMPYKQREKLLGDVFAKADWYTTDVVSITVDGDTAALEVLRKAQGPGSHKYENTVMSKFTVKDGKITEIREFIDLISFGSYLGISGIFDLLVDKKN